MSRQPVVAKIEKQLTALVDRVNTLCLDQEIGAAPPLAMTIRNAAQCVGMSVPQFRRIFINTGRLTSIHMGERARVIDAKELRAAYLRYISEVGHEPTPPSNPAA